MCEILKKSQNAINMLVQQTVNTVVLPPTETYVL